MTETRHDMVPISEHLDQRLADLTKLGGVALAGVVACGWVAFWLKGEAVAVALDSERRSAADKAESLAESLVFHNGKIRQSEIERAEERATLVTKKDVEPLVTDYNQRIGSSMTRGRFWTTLAVMAPILLAAGALLAKVLPSFGG
jgi:hypothetical protein